MKVRKFFKHAPEVVEPPRKPRVMKVHDIGVDDSVLDILSEAFDNLYDPDNMDHLPLHKQLSIYRHQDLEKAKYYKAALKYFGKQRPVMEMLGNSKGGRKRIIVAEPMAFTRDGVKPTDCELFNTPMSQPSQIKLSQSEERFRAREECVSSDTELAKADYASKLAQRRQIQKDLSTIGNLDKWLAGKPNKNPAELKAWRKILRDRAVDDSEEEEEPEGPPSPARQAAKRPIPIAFSVINEELRKKKLRLLDLFTCTDKDKSWTLSREEFKKSFEAADIQVPEDVLEDLFIYLDYAGKNELNYKELAVGLEEFRVQSRSTSRTGSTFTFSTDLSITPDLAQEEQSYPKPLSAMKHLKRIESPPIVKKPHFSESPAVLPPTSMSQSLEDETLKPPPSPPKPVKTGNKAVDDHLHDSQLEGEIAVELKRYRQDRYKEYSAILELCQKKGISFDEKLLEKVLLYPKDKSLREMRRKIHPPGSKLELCRREVTANCQQAAEQAIVRLHRRRNGGKMSAGGGSKAGSAGGAGQVGTNSPLWGRPLSGGTGGGLEGEEVARHGPRRGVNLAQVGGGLPAQEDLWEQDEDEYRVHLTTGWATVKRKVDCWLSFEEYEKLTGNLENQEIHASIQPVRSNAFWPGQMLHKFRLYLDHPGQESAFGPESVFNHAGQSRWNKTGRFLQPIPNSVRRMPNSTAASVL